MTNNLHNLSTLARTLLKSGSFICDGTYKYIYFFYFFHKSVIMRAIIFGQPPLYAKSDIQKISWYHSTQIFCYFVDTKKINGLIPNNKQTTHSFQHTGTPLRGGKKVQFNMFLRKIDRISLTENLRTSLMPVLWVEEGIELNDEMVNLIKGDLVNVLLLLDIVQWGLVGFGSVLALGMFSLFFCGKNKKLLSASVEPIYSVRGANLFDLFIIANMIY